MQLSRSLLLEILRGGVLGALSSTLIFLLRVSDFNFLFIIEALFCTLPLIITFTWTAREFFSAFLVVLAFTIALLDYPIIFILLILIPILIMYLIITRCRNSHISQYLPALLMWFGICILLSDFYLQSTFKYSTYELVNSVLQNAINSSDLYKPLKELEISHFQYQLLLYSTSVSVIYIIILALYLNLNIALYFNKAEFNKSFTTLNIKYIITSFLIIILSCAGYLFKVFEYLNILYYNLIICLVLIVSMYIPSGWQQFKNMPKLSTCGKKMFYKKKQEKSWPHNELKDHAHQEGKADIIAYLRWEFIKEKSFSWSIALSRSCFLTFFLVVFSFFFLI